MTTKRYFLMLLVMLMSVAGTWADTPVIHRGVTIDHSYMNEHFADPYVAGKDWLAFDCVLVNDGEYDITTFYDDKLKKTIDMYPLSVGALMNSADYADYKALNPQAASTDFFVMNDLQLLTHGGGKWTYHFFGYFTGFYTKQEMADSLEAINAAATYKLSASVLTTWKNNILNAAIADARGLYDSYVEQIKHLLHVVYNPNASGIGSAKTDDIIISGSIKGSQFTRRGYTFTEWNTQADGSGTTYNPGDVITVSDNGELVLYAQWAANQYTVTLDMQGGGEGTTSVTATYDDAMPEITIPTREDYAFLGYFSQPNGAGTKYYNANGTSTHLWDIANNTTTLFAQWKLDKPLHYIDADGSEKTITEYTTITNESSTLTEGWYVVQDLDVQTGTLVCEGDVHLILADGAKLTATCDESNADAGIRVSDEGTSLTIYGQQNQSGQLIANGGNMGSGIGGGDGADGHDITINGGEIHATGGNYGSGIGGGKDGAGHDITINGGVIHATGGDYGSGIGGGDGAYGHGYNITINGGVIYAAGSGFASGIGGGDGADGHDITINGGVIHAAGGSDGSGIGGGDGADGHDITINGGEIHATGGNYGSGIGGGKDGAGHDITINGGVIHAAGSGFASGIGGGNDGAGHDITINGGVIYAITGSTDASAIGGGRIGVASNIFINEALILKVGDNEQSETEIEHFSIEDDLTEVFIEKRYATLAFPSVNLNHASDMAANFGTFYHAYAAYTVPNKDATIYTASVENVNNETCLVLHEIEGGVIPAATPVILRTDETTTIDLQPCADASGISVPANSLSGANLPMEAPANCYILSYGQNGLGFYKYAEGKTLSAHKAYFVYQQPAGAPAFRMVFEDEETGIEDPLQSPLKGEDAIYNLNGIRLDKLQKGINIVNGKKILVK